MRRLCQVMLLGMLSLTAVARGADPQAEGVRWHTSLKAAHQVALAQKKPILIVFSADWCTYCHKLERNVINQPEMATYINEHFVPVHLDADRDEKVAEILEVDSLPCSVVLSPNADLLGRFKGYTDARKYAANLSRAEQVYRELQTAAAPGNTVTR